jgi:hypothetical protein
MVPKKGFFQADDQILKKAALESEYLDSIIEESEHDLQTERKRNQNGLVVDNDRMYRSEIDARQIEMRQSGLLDKLLEQNEKEDIGFGFESD